MAVLTWLIEEAPELILDISLALLQVLLLEARGGNKVTLNNSARAPAALPCPVLLLMREEGKGSQF